MKARNGNANFLESKRCNLSDFIELTIQPPCNISDENAKKYRNRKCAASSLVVSSASYYLNKADAANSNEYRDKDYEPPVCELCLKSRRN